MARDFSKTTSNTLRLGIAGLSGLVHGASAVSLAGWVNLDSTTTGADDNTVISAVLDSGSVAGLRLMVDGVGATRRARIAGRSRTADSYQSRSGTGQAISLSTWQHVGGVLNFAAGTLTPYANGVADNSGSGTFGVTAYVNVNAATSDAVGTSNANATTGVSPTTAAQVDGRIAEVAAWTGDIGASGFASLAKGFSPLLVRPDLLALYLPLFGTASPELERMNRVVGTIVGTVAKADHPPIRYPAAFAF